jgi:hypothetical protein
MIIKTTIIRYLMIALAAFALGTFFPNPVAKNKAQGEAITWAKQLGFGPQTTKNSYPPLLIALII